MNFVIRVMVALATAGLVSGNARAQQDYPNKPIKLIVPFAAGGPTDAWARLIGKKLADAWGQPVLIDNRAGATGLIGTNLVKEAQPDGYTLLYTSNSAHVIGPLLRNPAPFDPAADFTPVIEPLRYAAYLVSSPKLQVKTFKELIALAKSKPGKLNYSSVGNGSGGHLACEMMNLAAGINTVHVPYKGAAPAQAAVMAGETEFTCDSIGNSQAMVNAGRLIGLATTGSKRSSALNGVPTMTEEGVPVVAYVWQGVFGPKGMPKQVRDKIAREVLNIMNQPEVRDRVNKEGSEVMAESPEQFAKSIGIERAAWAKVITEKNIKAD